MSDVIVLQTKDLTKRFGDFVALDSVTFSVGRGHILGFIGPNGAGKTTCIRILVGLSRPTSGSATIAGHDCLTESRKIKRLVGFMPDTFGSYDNMRAREYLDFFGAAFKIRRRDRQRRIDEVMEMTGATYMKDRFVESLSHGMKQRLGIARTLMHDPEVLILDEPANGLDPNARIEMREILLNLAKLGKTLIVTSHILPELSRICDTVAIITQGKLRAFGTLDQIMRKVRQRRVVEFQLLHAQHVPVLASFLREHLEATAEVRTSTQESEVRVTTDCDDRKLAELLTAAVAKGFAISRFGEVMLDLEDAFLQVTRSAEEPQPPRAPRAEPAAKSVTRAAPAAHPPAAGQVAKPPRQNPPTSR